MREEQYLYDYYLNRYKKVRVFLSSTFRDMTDEREIIMESLAPKLKEWARKYEIDLEFIDLRWGISIEAQHNGKALPICLKAIDDCVPFFVSLVGESRGSIVDFDSLNNEVKELINDPEKESQMNFSAGIKNIISFLRENKDKNRAYTEMEILYAATKDMNKTLFLLRHALGKTDIDMDDATIELRNKVSSLGAKDYTCFYNDSTSQMSLFFMGNPDGKSEIRIPYNHSKSKEENMRYGADFLECIEQFVKDKCIEEFGKDRFSSDRFLRDTELELDYYEFNRIRNHMIGSGDFRREMGHFFNDKTQHVLKINCAEEDRKYYITQTVNLLVEKYDVDFIFSYESLSKLKFSKKMTYFIKRNSVPSGVMPYYPQVLKELRRLVVVIAPDGLSDVLEEYGTNNVIYITFEDLNLESGIRVYDAKSLSTAEKRQVIETELRERCKKLSDSQIELLAESNQVKTYTDLYKLVDDLLAINNFEILNNYIDERFGNLSASEDKGNSGFPIEHIKEVIACSRETYNMHIRRATKTPTQDDFAAAYGMYFELLDTVNEYYSMLIKYKYPGDDLFDEVAEIVKLTWLVGIELSGYLNYQIKYSYRADSSEKDMEDCIYKLSLVKDQQIILMYYMQKLGSGRFNDFFKRSDYELYGFSVTDDFCGRSIKEQYELLDVYTTLKVVDRKKIIIFLRYLKDADSIEVEAKGDVAMTEDYVINTYSPRTFTCSLRSLEKWPQYYTYTSRQLIASADEDKV